MTRRGQAIDPSDIRKSAWPPGTMLSPVPVVLVTTVDAQGKPNAATVAWTGTVCSEPPMVSISLREATYTYHLLRECREFVVNVPTVQIARSTDFCGVRSGRDVDKFAETGLLPTPAEKVKPPLIAQCPLNIECVLRQEVELGSHTMFIGEVVAVQVNEKLVKDDRLALDQANLIAWAHGHYYALGKRLGHFGYSVRKTT